MKSLILTLVVVGTIGVAAYFMLHSIHSSPAVAEKQGEGPRDPPSLDKITGLARSGDGHMLATVNDDRWVALWDATSGKSLRVLQGGEKEWIYAPAFSPDGSLLATASSTGTYTKTYGSLLLWNPATGERLVSVGNLSWPNCVSFNPAGTLIAIAGASTLYLVNPSTKEITQQVELQHVVNAIIGTLAFSPSGDLLATGERNGAVKLWHVPELNLVRTFSVGPSVRGTPLSEEDKPAAPQARSVAFAHNLSRLAAHTSEGSIIVWDLDSGKEIVRYAYDFSRARADDYIADTLPNSVSFTSDDRWLVSMNQRGNGIRLLGAQGNKEAGDLLTIPRDGELEALDLSHTNDSVALAYRVFTPGQGASPAKFETWTIHAR